MQVLIATSEAVPFAQAGGVAEVCGALPAALAGEGVDVALVMPCYRSCREAGRPIESTGIEWTVPIGSKTVAGRLLRSTLPGSDVPVWLIEQDEYYGRDGLYGTGGTDYIDNCERFVFFCRSVMELIRLAEWDVDVLHCNNWPTALIPAYLKIEYAGVPRYEQIATLITVHNLAWQGQFWHWDMLLTGLDWKYFNWQQMEYYGKLNLLKTGLVFADWINTVSPRYAREIQTAPLGYGLEGVLQDRRDELSGILNGADYTHWDPQADSHLPKTYGAEDISEGKTASKLLLQKEFGLAVRPEVPLVGMFSNMLPEKGLDIALSVVESWGENRDVQFVFLGSGTAEIESGLSALTRRFTGRVGAKLHYDERLAHLILGGSDVYLMPSRFEPCGLSQLYAMRYGTPPVVRATGGLADTVVDTNEATLESDKATGFVFREYSALALSETLSRAWEAFQDREVWQKLIATGMRQDWSWRRSAPEYVELYRKLVARRRDAADLSASGPASTGS